MAGVKDSFEESFAEYEGEVERPEADETAGKDAECHLRH
jgi:hypothetical protein